MMEYDIVNMFDSHTKQLGKVADLLERIVKVQEEHQERLLEVENMLKRIRSVL